MLYILWVSQSQNYQKIDWGMWGLSSSEILVWLNLYRHSRTCSTSERSGKRSGATGKSDIYIESSHLSEHWAGAWKTGASQIGGKTISVTSQFGGSQLGDVKSVTGVSQFRDSHNLKTNDILCLYNSPNLL